MAIVSKKRYNFARQNENNYDYRYMEGGHGRIIVLLLTLGMGWQHGP